jgi:hypothetical protein
MMQQPSQPKGPASIATMAEAAELADRLRRTIAELSALLGEETALVRAARMKAAAPLEARKGELSRRYMADLSVLKANAGFMRRAAGPVVAALERENAVLREALEVNLAVLATAHAVAEGIIRAVSTTVQAKRTPTAYGANGRAATPPPRTSAPVAVSRRL